MEKQMVSLHTSASILLPFCRQLLGGFGRKSYKKKLLESADRTDILLKPLAVYALLWSPVCLRWTFSNWNGNNLMEWLDWWSGPRLIILSVVLRFILLTFLLGKVNIVVLHHVVGNVRLTLSDSSDRSDSKKALHGHSVSYWWASVWGLLSLSFWYNKPLWLIYFLEILHTQSFDSPPSFTSGVCRFQPFRVFFIPALLMDPTYLGLSACCARHQKFNQSLH